MSADYWDTFKRNGREIIESRMPAGWELATFDASDHRVSARFTWAGGHDMTIETDGPSEHQALSDLVRAVEGLERQTWR